MALKIVHGVVEEVRAHPVGSDGGLAWETVRFNRPERRPVVLTDVVADAVVGACLTPGRTGRFAFYTHGKQSVLCGFSDSGGMQLAEAAQDPAAIAAEAFRTPAKRKIFLGVVLCLTIIGLFFGPQMIQAGQGVLREHPAPRRPPDSRLRRGLAGRWVWPF